MKLHTCRQERTALAEKKHPCSVVTILRLHNKQGIKGMDQANQGEQPKFLQQLELICDRNRKSPTYSNKFKQITHKIKSDKTTSRLKVGSSEKGDHSKWGFEYCAGFCIKEMGGRGMCQGCCRLHSHISIPSRRQEFTCFFTVLCCCVVRLFIRVQ